MGNLLDNITDALGKNKKNLMYAVIAYIIVSLIIVIAIWWPKAKDYLKYDSINIEEKQQELAQSYMNDISLLFRTGDKQAIKEIISSEYANYVDKSKDEIVSELDSNGFFSLYSEMKGMDIYVDENTYVYTTTIYYNDNSRRINIVETQPYRFSIVFDDFYKYNENITTRTSQNVKFTINSTYRNLKYIEYDMSIENLNTSYIRMDFNSVTCVQAVLEDGKVYSVANLVSTSDYTEIESNTKINKKFIFEIPAQLQNKISHIVFNGVVMEFSTSNIRVSI